jgi:hypothetical protein
MLYFFYTPTYVSTIYLSSSGGSKYIYTGYTSIIIVGSSFKVKTRLHAIIMDV